MPSRINVLQATIANGQSLSDAQQLDTEALTVIEMPASWTAAALAFEVSSDGATYRSYLNADASVYRIPSTGAAVASKAYRVPPADFCGVRWVKVKSVDATDGTTGVNQGAARIVRLVERPV